ncbi:MAG: hypothetical protein LBK28_05190 [Propionibacteriaceae bacterium]|nr:hypothetical protein [Propionibacteriaceae bacterium]
MGFIENFRSIVNPRGRSLNWAPVTYVDVWEELADEISGGYRFSFYEYMNDLSVRDVLECALQSDALDCYPEWSAYKSAVARIDGRMRALLADGPEVRPSALWWYARLPAIGSHEFVEDVKAEYGIDLEECNPE